MAPALGQIPGSGAVGTDGKCVLDFIRKNCNAFQSGCPVLRPYERYMRTAKMLLKKAMGLEARLEKSEQNG